jgi:hypothetical protein
LFVLHRGRLGIEPLHPKLVQNSGFWPQDVKWRWW